RFDRNVRHPGSSDGIRTALDPIGSFRAFSAFSLLRADEAFVPVDTLHDGLREAGRFSRIGHAGRGAQGNRRSPREDPRASRHPFYI
ncbi:MAG TPA: hypothetical protein PLY73_01500, partial [Candidatus Ozemobacteraceae bacterium]|nr:hypothetical protein [Candidatus Ozemobacteraceae bacterium]